MHGVVICGINKMPVYLTEYPCGGAKFASYVVAKDRAHPRKLDRLRGLQETIVGYAFMFGDGSGELGRVYRKPSSAMPNAARKG